MTNTKKLNDRQKTVVSALLAHFAPETRVTRIQLRAAHGELFDKKASPAFITKNTACKVKISSGEFKGEYVHGLYNLAVFAGTMKGFKPSK